MARRRWLEGSARGVLKTNITAAQRDLNHAITQIEQLILAGGYKPEPRISDQDDIVPESEPAPEPESEQSPRPDHLSTDQASQAIMRWEWATPDDDAIAVLAFSNGKWAGAQWACAVLFHKMGQDGQYHEQDMLRSENAMRLARKRGVNKTQMERARRELAMSGALAVQPGRCDLVDSGLSRFRDPWGRHRTSKAQTADDATMRAFQRLCLDSGRLDLAGDWTDNAVRGHGQDFAARTGTTPPTGLSCAVTMDGMRRASLAQLANTHPLALEAVSHVAQLVFRHGTTDERLSMATWLLELVAGPATHTSRGDRHHHISQLLYDLREFGISARERTALADQLAGQVGAFQDKSSFNGTDLLARTRLG
ncbi:hypothetical protein ABT301_00815 [Streptomyces sp. NPDC000987]|uniref:hypothetical protein n=1 Tax=Streptomyces sp. NPDC000987 TaxID=3154374 RepID=UPI00331B18B3